MKWIYILRCTDDFHYVGQTSRLFRRFWEHEAGVGGSNTTTHPPRDIIAIYPIHRLGKFLAYDQKVQTHSLDLYSDRKLFDEFNMYHEGDDDLCDPLFLENKITEKLIFQSRFAKVAPINSVASTKTLHYFYCNDALSSLPSSSSSSPPPTSLEVGTVVNAVAQVRGGKYVRSGAKYKLPATDELPQLPTCKCGLPCDVRKNDHGRYLYFRCAKKNMWRDMRQIFLAFSEPCNYFQRYFNDVDYRPEYDARMHILDELTKVSPWLRRLSVTPLEGGGLPSTGQLKIDNYVVNARDTCIGGCGVEVDSHNGVLCKRRRVNLCVNCFISKHSELCERFQKR